MRKATLALVLISCTSYLLAQNPITNFTQELEYELSTGSGRLGAMEDLINEIVSDGAITPEDFIKMIHFQRRLYDSASDDFGIKEALEPKFELLAQRLEIEIVGRFKNLRHNDGEDVVRKELDSFLKQLGDIASVDASGHLNEKELDEIFDHFDDTMGLLDVRGILQLISEFTH